MFPGMQKLIDLLERAVIALERIADAQEVRTRPEAESREQAMEREAQSSIRLRDFAQDGLEARQTQVG
jgi:hypothetical protein